MESLEGRRVLATVTGFEPTPSGFRVELSEQIASDNLNLYDVQSGAFGPADVTLSGAAGGTVKGSLVVNGNELTFLATGGVLPADTYTVTLRSANNAIVDAADGGLLDGEFSGNFPSGNGTPGGNFVTTFSVAAGNQLVIGLPDFARGPTQPIQAPVSGSGTTLPEGLPIQLSNAQGVTSVTMVLNYDPALMNLTAVELGSDAPQGSQVQANLSTPGVVTISFFSLQPMAAGAADIINLVATVPEDAPYGQSQVLRLSSLDVNGGALTARADDALHLVAFPGDANANRRYDAEDARLIARVGAGLDSGLVLREPTAAASSTNTRLYPTIDPMVLADVTGVDGISPLDASDILRNVVGLSTPNLPALPDAQAPTGLTLSNNSIAENQPSGTTIGTFTTNDPDAGDTFTYSLVNGEGSTDNASFTISGNTLRTASVFDFDTKSSYRIRVQTTDSTGRTLQRSFTISVTELNTAPTAISFSNSSVAENATVGTTVGTLTSTDANAGDTFTYSLVSGTGSTDNASFTISGNQLRTATTLDFETQPSYSVRVRTTDAGGLTFERTFTITVTNVNESPSAIALSSTTLENNAASGTAVGTLTTTDADAGDTFTYTLVDGQGSTDNTSFAIDGGTLEAATTINFASQSSYSVRVRSTDAAGLFTEQTFTITQSTTNTAPTDLSLSSTSIAENAAVGTTVGTLTSTDANAGDTFTYSLVSGTGSTDNASFTISGDQLRTATTLDFETKSSYSVRVRTTDAGNLTFERTFTITVTNVNEAPSAIALSSTTLDNNAASGTAVGTLTTTDADAGDTFTYTLVDGQGSTDNTSFAIDGGTLEAATTINFASQSSYSVRVRSTDAAGLSTEQTFTITPSNPAPTDLSLSSTSIAENAAVGTTVGTLTSTDANAGDTFTYSLVSGTGSTDNASFTISGDQLQTATTLDFETKPSYSVRVRTTDAGGLTFEETFTITVTNVNEAPSAISLSSTTLDNNAASGTAVGTLTTTDADAGDSFTYTLVDGQGSTDNGSFTINGSALETNTTIDFASQSSYSVRVRSADAAGLSTEQTFTITPSNPAPTDLSLSSTSIAEDAAVGTTVGTLTSTDANAGDTFTYSLVSGTGSTDNASFTISGDQLQTATTLDFETKPSYSVRVRTTDAGGLTFEETFTITVTNINEAPSAISLSSTTLENNAASGTAVGTLTTTDADAGDSFTYTLVDGQGSTDNGSFTINGSALETNTTIDFASQSSYSVRVRSTDAAGLFTEQTFMITPSNPAPTDLSLSSTSIAEDAAVGTTVGTLTSTDANAGDMFTYSLISGTGSTDNASFTISGDQLQTATTLDFETQPSYSIRIRTTDAGDLTFEQTFTITVTNVNEAPSAIAVAPANIASGESAGTVVGNLSSVDPDASDTFSYAFATGDGSTDNSAFSINNNQLVSNEVFDSAIKDLYSVRVQVTDAGGLTHQEILNISINAANVAPTDISLSSTSIANNAPSGTVVGQFSTTDADGTGEHTYQLVEGTGSDNNTMFVIVGDELRTAFDMTSESTLRIRVLSQDRYGESVEREFVIAVNNSII
ncbi:beta strand repeat-containing protein [Neorhodopirellula pilleata]|uniref:beta strand repeat-containing protein n=1 Tax=Neorhodopirellula pilleata TaxID=2714738 RepID=UPI001E3ED24B|nr:cadherin domain-containing protein [Neorhodopirellula pilleata]